MRQKKASEQDPIILSSYVDPGLGRDHNKKFPRCITATHSDGGNAVCAIHHCIFGTNKIVLCGSDSRADRDKIEKELGFEPGTIGIVCPNSRPFCGTVPMLRTRETSPDK